MGLSVDDDGFVVLPQTRTLLYPGGFLLRFQDALLHPEDAGAFIRCCDDVVSRAEIYSHLDDVSEEIARSFRSDGAYREAFSGDAFKECLSALNGAISYLDDVVGNSQRLTLMRPSSSVDALYLTGALGKLGRSPHPWLRQGRFVFSVARADGRLRPRLSVVDDDLDAVLATHDGAVYEVTDLPMYRVRNHHALNAILLASYRTIVKNTLGMSHYPEVVTPAQGSR